MKKILFVSVLLAAGLAASAQEIGIRFGQVVGGNVALDAVFRTGEFNRVHADVSFGSGVGVEALWDFTFRPLGGEAFYWYAGVGPSLLIDDPFYFGLSGELGLEYRFNQAPIAIGMDWRPTFWLIETTDFVADGFGLNIRFVLPSK